MAEQRLMKDGLDEAAIKRVSGALKKTLPDFANTHFLRDALDGIDVLELKGRVRHLIAVLHTYLPNDFTEAAPLLAQLKKHWDPGDPEDNLRGFAAWPVIDYVGVYGLTHPELALGVLKKLTSMFSAEFAIRPFFIQHQELTLKTVKQWIDDSDEHVRRLVSEGCRPRLPWGQQLPEFIRHPEPVIALLEQLKDDPSEYVRRSVANNLNDISKDHPDTVIALCKRWKKGANKNREWIIRHATRSLVKSGHPETFGLLGYTENPRLNALSLEIVPTEIKLGESITFYFNLQSTNTKPQSVVIDYVIHHVKANGQTSPKVFKFRTLDFEPGVTVELRKKHTIKAITTRKYYPGEHAIEILINGKTYGRSTFRLLID